MGDCPANDKTFTDGGGIMCQECQNKKDEHGLSYRAKQDYIETGGNSCPFCGSEDIEGGFINTDSCYSWQKVKCNECEKRWKDIYTLTDIEVDE
jgi:hypothetical protein